MSSTRITRALVVDEHALTRKGIVTCFRELEHHPDVCPAETAREARELCASKEPDVITLKLPLPDGQGFGFIRELHRLHPPAAMLLVLEKVDRQMVDRCFALGALALMQSRDLPEELSRALAAMQQGERFISSGVHRALLVSFGRRQTEERRPELLKLSERELEVFELYGADSGPKAIAARLGVGVKTIETHLNHVKEKLGMTSMAELRAYAHRLALPQMS